MKQIDYNAIFEKQSDRNLTLKEQTNLKKILGKKISEQYWHIMQNYAGIYLKEEICFKSIEKSHLTSINGYDRINRFLDYDSILKTAEIYKRQIPKGYIAIAEKDGGNFLCINKKTGYIYIWVHDAPEGEDVFLVNKSLEEFMESLECVDQKEKAKSKVVRCNFSSDFFDRL